MKPFLLACSTALSLCLPASLAAQDSAAGRQESDPLAALPPDQAAAHRELTAFRVGIQEAFNRAGASRNLADMNALLEYADPDILFTDMTGESLRGRPALLEYFRRELLDEGRSLERMHSEFAADHLAILLAPDMAVSRGSGRGTFLFVNGNELAVDTRWTATLVKRGGVWKLAAFHFSPPLFDNPVVRAYKGWIYKGAAIAGVLALVIGTLIGRATRRPRIT